MVLCWRFNYYQGCLLVSVPTTKEISEEGKEASRRVLFLILSDSAVLKQDLLCLEIIFEDLVRHQTCQVRRQLGPSFSIAACSPVRFT